MPSKKRKNFLLNPIFQVFLLSFLSLLVVLILIIGFSIHQESHIGSNLPPVKFIDDIPKFDLVHIEFFLKSLKFYKLHTNIFGMDPAKIKLVIMDSNQVFYVVVTFNMFKISEKKIFEDPDMIIYLRGQTLLYLLKNPGNFGLVKNLIRKGDIRINYNVNKLVLFMKGFYATALRP